MTYTQPPAALGDDKFFSALFDLSFTKYLALNWIKVVYIVGLIGLTLLLILRLLGVYSYAEIFLLYSKESGLWDRSEAEEFAGMAQAFNIVVAILDYIFSVAMLRVGLEVVNAWVRATRSWQNIRRRQEQGYPLF